MHVGGGSDAEMRDARGMQVLDSRLREESFAMAKIPLPRPPPVPGHDLRVECAGRSRGIPRIQCGGGMGQGSIHRTVVALSVRRQRTTSVVIGCTQPKTLRK